ncbi:MAG: ABC transporter ATP-binding protein [Candidatus Zixiibacteriota bacterium]|nr:MAG: ABC transporter ATP-binding protein [candidate division Zixibacteria bacterium]
MDDSRPAGGGDRQFATVTKYLRRYRKYLIIGSVAVISANVLVLIIPYISKLVFDALEAGRPNAVILRYVALAFALAVISGVFRFTMRRTIIWMSRYIEYDLRGEVFTHLLRLTPSFYHNTRTGDLMARMTNDLEAVRQMIGPGIMYISDTIVKLTVAFGIMIYLSPKLTLYAVLPLIILPVTVNRLANLLHVRSMRVQEKFSELTATAQENLSGIRVVKAYRQEEPEIANFSVLSRAYIALNMALARLQGMFIPSMRLTASLSYLVVFYFGGLEIIRGGLRLGDVVAFFGYLAMILWPMIAIGWVTALYQRGKASLQRINRVLHTQPQVQDAVGELYDRPMKGAIELRHLTFSYNGHTVLDNINLTVEPGQTVGLIGKTGSGKTTLVSLLARLFPVEQGRVFIDGVDINDWSMEALRRQVGFATQEPFLFSDTVAENIRFGHRQADDADIAAAAEIAALSKDIEGFRDGFGTIVGERGITLSGGQKQRTAIARAIVKKPAIVVLDDATSAVDTETEHEISERIKKILTNRTAVVISHRVSSVKDADLILYMHHGAIVERGRHQELLDRDGHYARLYRSQLLEMELERL